MLHLFSITLHRKLRMTEILLSCCLVSEARCEHPGVPQCTGPPSSPGRRGDAEGAASRLAGIFILCYPGPDDTEQTSDLSQTGPSWQQFHWLHVSSARLGNARVSVLSSTGVLTQEWTEQVWTCSLRGGRFPENRPLASRYQCSVALSIALCVSQRSRDGSSKSECSTTDPTHHRISSRIFTLFQLRASRKPYLYAGACLWISQPHPSHTLLHTAQNNSSSFQERLDMLTKYVCIFIYLVTWLWGREARAPEPVRSSQMSLRCFGCAQGNSLHGRSSRRGKRWMG